MFELVNNVLIGEQITKLIFCRLLNWFVALRYQGVYYIWYQSQSDSTRAYLGSKWIVLTNGTFLFCGCMENDERVICGNKGISTPHHFLGEQIHLCTFSKRRILCVLREERFEVCKIAGKRYVRSLVCYIAFDCFSCHEERSKSHGKPYYMRYA